MNNILGKVRFVLNQDFSKIYKMSRIKKYNKKCFNAFLHCNASLRLHELQI